MSSIAWERAWAVLCNGFAEKPADWPQRLSSWHVAVLQASAGDAVDSREFAVLQAAVTDACTRGDLPHEEAEFQFRPPARRTFSRGIDGPPVTPRPSQTPVSQKRPGIAAGDFVAWLVRQGVAPSTHVKAWADATTTEPAARLKSIPTIAAPPVTDAAQGTSADTEADDANGLLARVPRGKWKNTRGHWTNELLDEVNRLNSRAGGGYSMSRLAKAVGVERRTLEEALERYTRRCDKAATNAEAG